MSNLIDHEAREEPITKPPMRWRNWWRSLCDHGPCDYCGQAARYREVYGSCRTQPSRDIAETWASRQLADDIAQLGEPVDEYLGAFPEGKRP